ncbi:MAG: hypothetical protein LBR14_03700 [Clostridiales Family XIII bacterium]|nr:hypothetical protein [Clostridiales Family XIII bacterium]
MEEWEAARTNGAGAAISLPDKDTTILLYDARKQLPPQGWNALHRYAPVSEMAARIRQVYAEKHKLPIRREEENSFLTETIILFGAGGGSGVSSIAITLARALSVFRKRSALYVSLEAFESRALCPVSEAPAGSAAASYFHFLRGDRERFLGYLSAHLLTDVHGVKRFAPAAGLNPLGDPDSENLPAFLNALMREVKPDCLILDASPLFSARLIREIPDAVLIPVEAESTTKRFSAFQFAVQKAASGDFPQLRVLPAVNRSTRRPEEEVFPDGTPAFLRGGEVTRIPEDPASFHQTKDGIQIDLSGAFGRAVYELALRLTGEEGAGS